MSTIRELPLLAVIDLDLCLLHEYHDETRTSPLAEDLNQRGVLRNPPIVTPLHDRQGRYVVLDGANRVSALRQLGFRHILVQVVERDDPGLGISAWNHVIWDMDPDELYTQLVSLGDVVIKPCPKDAVYPTLATASPLARVSLSNGQDVLLDTPYASLHQRTAVLNNMVQIYYRKARMDRTTISQLDPLRKHYPDLSGVIFLPLYRVEQVLYLAADGHYLPPGSTRFTISPRVLHLDYPLDYLHNDWTLEAKNEMLQNWLSEKLVARKARFYAEATYLFDE